MAQAKIDAEQAARSQEAARKRAKEEADRRQLEEAATAADQAAAEVQRLERQAIYEAAEAGALDLADRAAEAYASQPVVDDLPGRAEEWAGQVLGVVIPAALWSVVGYGSGYAAQTSFLGGTWTFLDQANDEPALLLNVVPRYGGDEFILSIRTLSDLGEVLAEHPATLAFPEPAQDGAGQPQAVGTGDDSGAATSGPQNGVENA